MINGTVHYYTGLPSYGPEEGVLWIEETASSPSVPSPVLPVVGQLASEVFQNEAFNGEAPARHSIDTIEVPFSAFDGQLSSLCSQGLAASETYENVFAQSEAFYDALSLEPSIEEKQPCFFKETVFSSSSSDESSVSGAKLYSPNSVQVVEPIFESSRKRSCETVIEGPKRRGRKPKLKKIETALGRLPLSPLSSIGGLGLFRLFVKANTLQTRALAWKNFIALGECQSIKIGKDVVEVRAFATYNDHYECCFIAGPEKCPLENLECRIQFVGEEIFMTSFNNEAFLLTVLKYLDISWDSSQIESKWLQQSDWMNLKTRMEVDQSTSYSHKLLQMLEELFSVGSHRRFVSWIDLDATPSPRSVQLTYEYLAFDFQLIKKHPERLNLSKDAKMLSLYFWEESESSRSLLLRVNFLLDRPLMEIYSVAKGKTISGKEVLNFATELQSMLGVSAYLFDDAKIYASNNKQYVRLLLWRSLGSLGAGFYESRGFRLVDFTITVDAKGGYTTIAQKVENVYRARNVLSQMLFGDFLKIAKNSSECLKQMSSVLKISEAECSQTRVKEIADRILQTTQSEAKDSTICAIHSIEQAFFKGVSNYRNKANETVKHYNNLISGQFFVRPGYRPLDMPWTLPC